LRIVKEETILCEMLTDGRRRTLHQHDNSSCGLIGRMS